MLGRLEVDSDSLGGGAVTCSKEWCSDLHHSISSVTCGLWVFSMDSSFDANIIQRLLWHSLVFSSNGNGCCCCFFTKKQFLFRASCCFLVDLSQNTCCDYISQNTKRYFIVKKLKRLLRKKDWKLTSSLYDKRNTEKCLKVVMHFSNNPFVLLWRGSAVN